MQMAGAPPQVPMIISKACRAFQDISSQEEIQITDNADIPDLGIDLEYISKWWLVPEPSQLAKELANKLVGHTKPVSDSS
jgi:hypothetical protein